MKILQTLLLCIAIVKANCANLDINIKVQHDPELYYKSSILIRTLVSQEEDSEASLSPAEVHKWRLLNMPETAGSTFKTVNTPNILETNDMSSEVNTWRLLNTIPRSTTTLPTPSKRKWQLLNAPRTTASPSMQFPKEDKSRPSPHEYHPDMKAIGSTSTSKPMTTILSAKPLKPLQHKFNAKLYPILASKFAAKNLIYSPSSLETMLALLYYGAEAGTALQLQNLLEYPAASNDLAKQVQQSLAETSMSKADDFKFLMANKIYYRDDLILDPSFKQTALTNFHSDLERIDFAKKELAANNINQWVSDKTEQRIQQIIDAESLDADTQAVLVNAIYLKAKWAKEFSESDTEKMNFYARNDLQHEKVVDMMYIEDNFKYADLPALDASIVELPFQNSELSMLVIVPNRIDGLQAVEQRLKVEDLNDLASKMQMRKITLRMPKFKIETDLDMMEPLEKLGVHNIFTKNAEFGKIFSNNPNIRISKILHKAYINVNEGGVEAAAATYIQLVPLSLDVNMIYLTADHPFMFAIRSPQNVHFIGHVISDFQ